MQSSLIPMANSDIRKAKRNQGYNTPKEKHSKHKRSEGREAKRNQSY